MAVRSSVQSLLKRRAVVSPPRGALTPTGDELVLRRARPARQHVATDGLRARRPEKPFSFCAARGALALTWTLLVTTAGAGCGASTAGTGRPQRSEDEASIEAGTRRPDLPLGTAPVDVQDVLWSPVARGASSLVGDFDGDGALDLAAVSESRTVAAISRGMGDGTFLAPSISHADRLQAAFGRALSHDLGARGQTSLVYLSTRSNNDEPRLARASCVTFDARGEAHVRVTDFAGYAGPFALGALDGDGHDDMVIAYAGSNREARGLTYLQTLRGRGDGTFTAEPARGPLRGLTTRAALLADVDGDGRANLVLAGSVGKTLGVLWLLDPRAPETHREVSLLASPDDAATGDFDLDGTIDVAVVDAARARVSVIAFKREPFGVASTTLLSLPEGIAVAKDVEVADLDDDGALDLVLAGNHTRSTDALSLGPVAVVFWGDGAGAFEPPTVLQLAHADDAFGAHVVARDLDGDEATDLGLITHASDGEAKIGVLFGPLLRDAR